MRRATRCCRTSPASRCRSGFVVAGALVMEIVFSYPGVGLTLYNAVTSNDYPLAPGDLPGDLVRGAARVPARRRRSTSSPIRARGRGGVLMSALIAPLSRSRPVAGARRRATARAGGVLAAAAQGQDRRGDPAASSSWSRSSGRALAPYDPSATTTGQALPLGPSATTCSGTTSTGQDVLSQLLVGTALDRRARAADRGDRDRARGPRRRLGRLPRRPRRRGAVAARQRLPGAARAAAAGRHPRLPAALRGAADGDRAERPRLALGRARDPCPDAVAAQPGLRGRGARDRGARPGGSSSSRSCPTRSA